MIPKTRRFSLLALALLTIAIPILAPLEARAAADLYAAGKFSVSPFASYRAHEFGKFDGQLGAGLAVSYSLTRNLTLEAWTLSEEYKSHAVIDSLLEAGASLKFYAPLKDSGLAPYALIGYSRGIESAANNMETGVGFEYRFKGGLPLTLFVDGVWVQNFGLSDPVTYAHAKARTGIGWRF